jgi:hypothetical protein
VLPRSVGSLLRACHCAASSTYGAVGGENVPVTLTVHLVEQKEHAVLVAMWLTKRM